MKDQAQLRSQLYSALAQALSQPASELLEPGPENPLLVALERAGDEIPALALERQELLDFLRAGHIALLEREVEYNRLFQGPGPVPAPPYESVYRDQSGLVMGEAAVDVLRYYAGEKLALAPSFRDLPDHLAVELEFMAQLAWREAEAWGEARLQDALGYRAREHSFVAEHLAPWVPRFCQAIALAQASPFYLAVASILRHFLAWEMGAFRAPFGDPKGELRLKLAPGCNLCGACARACATGALKYIPLGEELALSFDGSLCNGCGQCPRSCPLGLLSLEDAGLASGVLARAPAARCQRCGVSLGVSLPGLQQALSQAHLEESSLCPQCRVQDLTHLRRF